MAQSAGVQKLIDLVSSQDTKLDGVVEQIAKLQKTVEELSASLLELQKDQKVATAKRAVKPLAGETTTTTKFPGTLKTWIKEGLKAEGNVFITGILKDFDVDGFEAALESDAAYAKAQIALRAAPEDDKLREAFAKVASEHYYKKIREAKETATVAVSAYKDAKEKFNQSQQTPAVADEF